MFHIFTILHPATAHQGAIAWWISHLYQGLGFLVLMFVSSRSHCCGRFDSFELSSSLCPDWLESLDSLQVSLTEWETHPFHFMKTSEVLKTVIPSKQGPKGLVGGCWCWKPLPGYSVPSCRNLQGQAILGKITWYETTKQSPLICLREKNYNDPEGNRIWFDFNPMTQKCSKCT